MLKLPKEIEFASMHIFHSLLRSVLLETEVTIYTSVADSFNFDTAPDRIRFVENSSESHLK